MFFVYVLYNKKRDKIYTGHTQNLETRIQRHNGLLPQKAKSYTSKNKGFWNLIYSEEFETRSEAIQREKSLKSCQGRKFIRENIISSLDR
ncbi:endonuclease [bacterium]|nr:endonuclease [bacterium]